MSLLIPGTARAKAFVLSLLATALVASMSLLGVPSASASTAAPALVGGVTVEAQISCSYIDITVTNTLDHVVWARTYEIRNDWRVDYNTLHRLEPGQSFESNTDGERYFEHSLGVTYGTVGVGPTGNDWVDLGKIDFVTAPGCPPMVAPATLSKRTKSVINKSQPVIRFKTTAYYTDLGYQVVGKGKRIKWAAEYQRGKGAMYGPRLKPGQRVKVKVYSRNRDGNGNLTDPVYIGTKKFKRKRG